MNRIRELFDLVCDVPEAERDAALRDANASAAEIAEVSSLLLADATRTRASAPLANFAAELSMAELHPGDTLGAWRLLKPIGQGGMGEVFLAERADGHYAQLAAVKLIRGQGGAEAVARFTRERQWLAALQHPQIARLLDGGDTPGGQPYLVMDYIEGAPIDQWCRNGQLGLAARLDLFRSICAVVQFAHQRLIAHCDLKPSNVLVREDGVPVLLDFGIARALEGEPGPSLPVADSPRSGDSGGATPMTPRYASPEQLRGEPPGVASDVFALGLMLYELTAATPPPRERGPQPLRPSATPEPVAWKRELAGDLDAIVARACAADPAGRYASVAELAQDVARHQRNEVVLAVTPTRAYRASRFVRRHALGVVAAAAVALALLAGLGGTYSQWRKAQQRADEAQALADFQRAMLSQIDTEKLGQTLRQATLDAAPEPERAALQQASAGINFTDVGLRALDDIVFVRALQSIDERFADQPLLRAALLQSVASTLRDLGLSDRAQAPQAQALALRREHLGDLHPDTLLSRWESAQLLGYDQGKVAEAETLSRGVLADSRRVFGDGAPQLLDKLTALANILTQQGKLDESASLLDEALALARRYPDDESTPDAIASYAIHQFYQGKLDEAIAHQREAVASYQRVHGPSHRLTVRAKGILGTLLQRKGELAEAEALQRETLAVYRHTLGDTHPDTLDSISNLSALLRERGNLAEALALGEESAQATRRITPRFKWSGANHLGQYARSLAKAQRHAQADAVFREAQDWFDATLGAAHERSVRNLTWAAENCEAWDKAEPGHGHAEQAAAWRARLPAPKP